MAWTPPDELKRLLSRKHILLDTNVIIDAYQSPIAFQELFQHFEQAPCALTISWQVRFELFRKAYDQNYRDRLQEFIDSLGIFILPSGMEKDFYPDALAIANVYAKKSIKAPSFVDCMIAAHIKRHASDLFLLTRNHSDFPLFLFDRKATWAIDNDKDVIALGLYEFSIQKATSIGL